jgi:hypothetical protein
MANNQVIPWKPEYNFESNPSLKKSYASAIGSVAANKAIQLNSARETEMAAANKFAQENEELFDKYSSLGERGGKMKKRRSTKRKKRTRKARKTKRNSRRRK